MPTTSVAFANNIVSSTLQMVNDLLPVGEVILMIVAVAFILGFIYRSFAKPLKKI